MYTNKSIKPHAKLGYWLMAAIISILIGFTIASIMGDSFKKPIVVYLWNMGYSTTIGLPLFANGLVFEWYEKRFIDWIKRPIKSALGALTINIIYSSIVIWVVNWFWFVFLIKQNWNDFFEYHNSIIISEYIAFIIIAAISYAISFFREWRKEMQQKEETKRQALALQYKVLQDQVNPHFLFNSLNVLESLIDIDIEKAKQFTHELSLFYRDILRFKDQDIVPLDAEVDFVKKYIYLQQIRFGESLQTEIIVGTNIKKQIVPLSLQTLVENAIKHNEISISNPLKIVIATNAKNELIVKNNLQPKPLLKETSKTGLNNLTGRYKYLTGKNADILNDGKYFRVTLPLIDVEI